MAVCDHVKSLTYLELHRLVNKAAAIIRRTAEPSALAKGVGLMFEPTVESVVGILGVLASGNFICPISPRDPPARVKIYHGKLISEPWGKHGDQVGQSDT